MAAAIVARYGYERAMRRERIFRDREHPLDYYNDRELYARYRFTREGVLYIAGLIRNSLTNRTVRSMALPPILQLMVALRFLGCGSFLLVVGDTLPRVSKSTVCRCVRRVCLALEKLACTFIKMPVGAGLNITKRGFASLAGFPNVIGAVDGTHVPIIGPSGDQEPDFVNRKGVHSLNVMAVCDHRFLITNAVIKWPGSVHDSRVFNESALGYQLAQDPPNGYLLGDSGYACKKFLLTPYYEPEQPSKINYNKAHCRTRVVIEQTFGIAKNRFPCLKYLRMKPERAVTVIAACFVLHNIACLRNEIHDVVDVDAAEADEEAPRGVNDGTGLRDYIAEHYFTHV